MHFSQASLGALALASSAMAATKIIKVAMDASGMLALAFDPPVTTAAKGDSVVFQWYGEHNVIQGDGSKPCQPLSGGFYSGLIEPATTGKVAAKEFVVTINDTMPIWYYCSYDEHCNAGMVGVINGDMSMYSMYKKGALSASGVGTPHVADGFGGSVQKLGSAIGGSGGSGSGGSGSGGSGSGGSGSGGSGSGGSGSGGSGSGGGSGASSSYSIAGGAVAFAALGLGALGF